MSANHLLYHKQLAVGECAFGAERAKNHVLSQPMARRSPQPVWQEFLWGTEHAANHSCCAHIPLCSLEIRAGQDKVGVLSLRSSKTCRGGLDSVLEPGSSNFQPGKSQLWVHATGSQGGFRSVARYPTSGSLRTTWKTSTILHSDSKIP